MNYITPILLGLDKTSLFDHYIKERESHMVLMSLSNSNHRAIFTFDGSFPIHESTPFNMRLLKVTGRIPSWIGNNPCPAEADVEVGHREVRLYGLYTRTVNPNGIHQGNSNNPVYPNGVQ